MKSGEIRKVANSYAALFRCEWNQRGSEFRRVDGDWVQIVSFNPSRFDEKYVPRSSLAFLKMPGPATAPFLLQELMHSKRTQRWVSLDEPAEGVFFDMSMQFRPRILEPLNAVEVRELLSDDVAYWPNAYALCVEALQVGDGEKAREFLETYSLATQDKPYPWVEERRKELETCIALLEESSEKLTNYLADVRINQAKLLRLEQ